jgi:hypothetical protein
MVKNFHFSISSRAALGSNQPPIHWVPPRGVKRQEREADHSLRTSAGVKKTWIYTSTPPIRLHDVMLCGAWIVREMPFQFSLCEPVGSAANTTNCSAAVLH